MSYKDKSKKEEYNKNYFQKNRDKLLQYQKEYRETHKQEISEKKRIYTELHKEEKRKYDIEYRKKNKERIKIRNRKNILLKYHKDNKFKILHNLRRRLLKVLKGTSKFDNTIKLIGCSLEELKKHLESKFKPGMSWDNYGRNGWEIDHIRPCASFDLSKEKEQRKCFYYLNLQPLWAEENNKKRANI